MNREIEFRAWDAKNKKMLTGQGNPEPVMVCWSGEVFPMHTSSDITGEYYSGVNLEDEDWQDDIILMQYTGLKDKNGTKIFEGDVVDFVDKWDDFSTKRRGYVDFSDASFMIKDVDGVNHYRWMDYEVEVIGKTHTDPHLLT